MTRQMPTLFSLDDTQFEWAQMRISQECIQATHFCDSSWEESLLIIAAAPALPKIEAGASIGEKYGVKTYLSVNPRWSERAFQRLRTSQLNRENFSTLERTSLPIDIDLPELPPISMIIILFLAAYYCHIDATPISSAFWTRGTYWYIKHRETVLKCDWVLSSCRSTGSGWSLSKV